MPGLARLLYGDVADKLSSIAIQLFASFAIYLLIRYRLHSRALNVIPLRRATVERLIEEYTPAPLVDQTEPEDAADAPVRANFAGHDLFGLGTLYKDEIRAAIVRYGVGTCGPRAFYGTVDVHIELEERLARVFGKPACALFPNHFLAVQSTVACFCRSKNTVYFSRHASEPILRGLYNSKAATVAYADFDDLEAKLDAAVNNKYVIVERLGKNTGAVADLDRLVALRRRCGFRVILDESLSLPLLYQEVDPRVYADVDVITGSLSLGYPGNGGFSSGSVDVVEYQRLSAHSYAFSASMPAFLARAALCFVGHRLDYAQLAERRAFAAGCIPDIVSDPRSPVLLVRCADAHGMRRRLRQAGYLCGVNGDYLRICVPLCAADGDLQEVGRIIKSGS